MISKEALLELRERTGAGMLDCKKALEETSGDVEEAVYQLRKKGLAKAASKSERATSEGVVAVTVSEDMHKGAIVELKCETDFVSRNEMFQNLTRKIAELAMHYNIPNKEDLINAHLNGSEKVSDALSNSIATFGENILIGTVFTAESENHFESYIHSNSKIAVLVEYAGENKNIAKDVAMHIAAMSPQCVSSKDIDPEVLKREKEVYTEMYKKDLAGKPKEIVEKILDGRMSKFFETYCLLSQKFAKNPEITVEEYIKGKIEIKSFKRVALGDK